MSKTWKTILIILIVGIAAFLIYRSLTKTKPPEEPDLEAMRSSIVADPVVNAPNLPEEVKNKFLGQFRKAREEVLKAIASVKKKLTEDKEPDMDVLARLAESSR